MSHVVSLINSLQLSSSSSSFHGTSLRFRKQQKRVPVIFIKIRSGYSNEGDGGGGVAGGDGGDGSDGVGGKDGGGREMRNFGNEGYEKGNTSTSVDATVKFL
ncbi:hypothetical protein HZH66_010302 [Vespula vulgaris]|uniref:Uncharacterized protein n=1 Tax=Vespula vulgaris TaxID=7454 RepID=A0A834MYF5_VESVU|nr:hypothetical protein HZH66_010302 [Vespula vulgaris]